MNATKPKSKLSNLKPQIKQAREIQKRGVRQFISPLTDVCCGTALVSDGRAMVEKQFHKEPAITSKLLRFLGLESVFTVEALNPPANYDYWCWHEMLYSHAQSRECLKRVQCAIYKNVL